MPGQIPCPVYSFISQIFAHLTLTSAISRLCFIQEKFLNCCLCFDFFCEMVTWLMEKHVYNSQYHLILF